MKDMPDTTYLPMAAPQQRTTASILPTDLHMHFFRLGALATFSESLRVKLEDPQTLKAVRRMKSFWAGALGMRIVIAGLNMTIF
jgi:hypothetical protein